jgi:hypothetical protein
MQFIRSAYCHWLDTPATYSEQALLLLLNERLSCISGTLASSVPLKFESGTAFLIQCAPRLNDSTRLLTLHSHVIQSYNGRAINKNGHAGYKF